MNIGRAFEDAVVEVEQGTWGPGLERLRQGINAMSKRFERDYGVGTVSDELESRVFDQLRLVAARGGVRTSAYFFKIAKNAVIDEIRRTRRLARSATRTESPDSDPIEAVADGRPSAEEALLAKELRAFRAEVFEEMLSTKERRALVGYLNGESDRQIATELETTPHAVRQRRYVAARKLRRCFRRCAAA